MNGIFRLPSGATEASIINTSGAANDGGLPVGSVIGIHSTVVPSGYLPCNGAQYDTTQYPALYAILGSDHLPDLRESVLVGSGLSENDYDEVTNPTGIHAHDVYTVGQFKDDQVENMPNGLVTASLDTYTTAEGIVHSEVSGNAPSDRTWRTGTTTHGKQYGINYIIKATTGTVQIADPEIIALIENWADMRFSATDRTNAYNNCLFRYDVINDTLVPLIKPSTNNTVLTASVTAGQVHNHNIYEMGGTYYLGSLQPTIQPIGELSSQTSVGYVVVASNDKWYTTDEISSVTYWFEVTSMLNGAFVYDINLPVTDSDLIDELNAATAQEVMYQTWSYQEETDIDYSWVQPEADKVGDLTNLNTIAKTNVVAAVNEVNLIALNNETNIGDLATLVTTDKSSLVAAINETNTGAAGWQNVTGDLSNLTTQSTVNLVAAINEVNAKPTGSTVKSTTATSAGNGSQKTCYTRSWSIGQHTTWKAAWATVNVSDACANVYKASNIWYICIVGGVSALNGVVCNVFYME